MTQGTSQTGADQLLKNNGGDGFKNMLSTVGDITDDFNSGGRQLIGWDDLTHMRTTVIKEDLRRLLEYCVRGEDGGAGRDRGGGDGNNLQLPIITTTRMNMS
jgi:hypothetical protein